MKNKARQLAEAALAALRAANAAEAAAHARMCAIIRAKLVCPWREE